MKIIKLKTLNLKIFNYKKIHYPLLFLISLSLAACFQTNLLENQLVPSGSHTVVIMPEQTCAEKENGRKLSDEKVLQQSHKECYYK
jgi:hypothetical protein